MASKRRRGTLYVTGEDAVDGLLNTDGTALLLGMLFDQQIPMERAFAAPATLRERLGHLDAARIAAMPVEEFVEVCARPPAVHRFPASMGRRAHEVCTVLAEQYGGRAETIWQGVQDAATLVERLRALPGFGADKTAIFVALLGKTQGVAPAGWREAAGRFGGDEPRSVADSADAASLAQVREWKRATKEAAKAATPGDAAKTAKPTKPAKAAKPAKPVKAAKAGRA